MERESLELWKMGGRGELGGGVMMEREGDLDRSELFLLVLLVLV